VNIERLQFADGVVDISGSNSAATGSLRVLDNGTGLVDTTPKTGQVLRASTLLLHDADNVTLAHPTDAVDGSVAYYWQELVGANWLDISSINSAGLTTRMVGPTYTP